MSENTMAPFFVFIALFFIKHIISLTITKKKESQTKSDTYNDEAVLMKKEIDSLKREAEKFNNPSDFVKYAKLERHIGKLKREYEEKFKSSVDKKEYEYDLSLTGDVPNLSYSLIGIEVVFYLISTVFLFLYRDQRFSIKGNTFDLKDNVVFNYFEMKEGDISIPINFILIVEGIFLHRCKSLIETVVKLL